jgi:LacI family transcriptional regulator
LRLEDVAKHARVSVSTVSRVVRGLSTVKPSTRKRVLKVLDELKYYPDLQARSLVVGGSRTIGVIVSNLENPFFVDIFHSIEEQAHRANFEILLANTNYNPELLVNSTRLMLGRRVAALAMVVSEALPPIIGELTCGRLPVAFFDVGTPGKKTTNVHFDYLRGMTQVVDHLYSLGHRRMAYIGHPLTLRATDERKDSFMANVTARKLPFKYVTVPQQDGFAGGREAVRELSKSDFKPTAILCVNDITAIGVIRELRNRGFSVPQDISVTGFDNIGISEFYNPSITTVHVPREKIGHLMFSGITSQTPDDAGREYLVDPELLVRESTGPVKIEKLRAS